VVEGDDDTFSSFGAIAVSAGPTFTSALSKFYFPLTWSLLHDVLASGLSGDINWQVLCTE
jgi:hypothetical protein